MTRLKAEGAPAAEVEAATFATKRANMTLSRSKWYYGQTSTPIKLHFLQIGPVVFAGCEGEPFHMTGKEIKAGSPFPATWFGGYTGTVSAAGRCSGSWSSSGVASASCCSWSHDVGNRTLTVVPAGPLVTSNDPPATAARSRIIAMPK